MLREQQPKTSGMPKDFGQREKTSMTLSTMGASSSTDNLPLLRNEADEIRRPYGSIPPQMVLLPARQPSMQS
jgi:hypothetical protein